jgi:D-cysteine desulfhydrase
MTTANFSALPRCDLSTFPTPLHRLDHLANHLSPSPQLWVKRDDQTTLALGGNKVRKLEFLIAHAKQQGADTIITMGGPQSNHCRLTAAACARTGLACHLVLGGAEAAFPNGNALLNSLCDAQVHYVSPEQRNHKTTALLKELRVAGRSPYLLPLGGSNGLGAIGYVLAMKELRDQFPGDWNDLDTIAVATSSGGTQAGLTLGARMFGFEGTVLGISIDQAADRQPSYQSEMADIANEAAGILQVDERLNGAEFHLNADYLGAGYGILGPAEKEAISTFAQCEGIFLGPVYTGRAFAGLLDLIRRREFSQDQTVLFWHTGGAPALFAYAQELQDVTVE